MRCLFVLFVCMACLCSAEAFAQGDAQGFEVLVIKSEANSEFCNAREVVGKRWDIQYSPFVGCVAGGGLIDHLLEQNEEAYALIAERYGANWQERFNKELQNELAMHHKARRLANDHGFIKLRKAYIERQGQGFSYSFTEEEKGIYRIRMFTGKEFYDRTEHPQWAVLVVDMNEEKVRVSPPANIASLGAH